MQNNLGLYEQNTIKAEFYSPIVLNYRNNHNNRKWDLNFQLHPEPVIIFSGDDPTTDEIVECIAQLNIPVWFIDVCKVSIGYVKKVNKDKL